MHNSKIQFEVDKFRDGLPLRRDITADNYFAAQVFQSRDKWMILVHYKTEMWGATPEEVDKNFMKYTFKVVSRLWKEYGISVNLDTFHIKHREWAYQFNLRRVPYMEGIQRFVAELSPHIRSYIDFSKGFLEIETTSDLWAMLFFLQPFFTLLTYSQGMEFHKSLNAYTVQIEKHLSVLGKMETAQTTLTENVQGLDDKIAKAVGRAVSRAMREVR